MPDPTFKNMVIPKMDDRLIHLYKESCALMDMTPNQGFVVMLRPFVDGVIRELELHPQADTVVLDAIHEQLDTLLPMPRVKKGGYVG